MSAIASDVARMVDMLPESDQLLAKEIVKKLVRAWDPDFTKLTSAEAAELEEAENSGWVNAKDIDWDKIGT